MYEMQCSRCQEWTCWESGTKYEAEEGNGNTSRFAEAILFLIRLVLCGCGEAGYREVCAALGMRGFTKSTNISYFYRFYWATDTLWNQPKALVQTRLRVLGTWGALVGLFGGGWLHRGYASRHGSAAIVCAQTGCIAWIGHRSKDLSFFGREQHVGSSSMMETEILTVLVAEAVDDKAKIEGLVADADSGTQNIIAGAGIQCMRCCNYGGKNFGNAGINFGKNGAAVCSCEVKQTTAGVNFKSGEKKPKRITTSLNSEERAGCFWCRNGELCF